MSLKLQLNGRVWIVSEGNKPVAEIHLDYQDQVGEAVLYADSSEEIQLQVLRLAASHVQQFMRDRSVPVFGGLMITEHRNQRLTTADSHRLMDFSLVSKGIQKLDRKTIIEALHPLRIDVVAAIHKTAQAAIESTVLQVGVSDLNYQVMPQNRIFGNEMALQFTVAEPNRFTFWRSESVPSRSYENLHIVPSYHPVMNGWKSVGMVNGDTDAYIGRKAVRSIHCPEAARSNPQKSVFGATWSHVKHPFYAVGQSVGIMLIATKIRSKEGAEELTSLLRAVLGLDKQYVQISGGFRAPMDCAHNRLIKLDRSSPYPRADHRTMGHLARGSEEHCVWAYRTLEQEGVLEKSYIPSWFISEGWLEIYKDAEVRPGAF